MKYYWSELYKSVFNNNTHKHIPEDCIEITREEYAEKINEMCLNA